MTGDVQPKRALSYRSDIDGIRAVAVLLVVVFHFHLVPVLDSGFMGVDVFFVISGFLITSIVQQQLAAGHFRLGLFWVHRIRRLAPALMTVTAATLTMGWLTLLPVDFVKLAQQTLAAQLYVANIFYWRSVNYFGLHSHDVYLLHTWSLAVEEQFYVFFPLILIGIARWAKGRTRIVLATLAAASFALNLASVAWKPEATFYLMPTRGWELVAGALLALRSTARRTSETEARWRQGYGAAGVIGLAAALVAYRPGTPYPGLFALVPVLSGVSLLRAGEGAGSATSRWLSNPVLVYIGKISYPLYLVHWPVNVFAVRWLGDAYAWPWRVAMLGLSFMLAAGIFHGVEGPVRRRVASRSPRFTVRVYAAALASVALASVVVLATQGMPVRYPDRVVELAAYAEDMPPPLRQCEYSSAPLRADKLCRLGTEGVDPQWLVFGDSHAWAASGAVDGWLRLRHQAAYFVFMHSCPPVRGVYLPDDTSCYRFNEAVHSFLAQQNGVAKVFLISTWLQAREGILAAAPGGPSSATDSMALFERQFQSTIDGMHRLSKRIYVWEPLPGALLSVPQAMADAALHGTPLALDTPLSVYNDRYAFFFDALRNARPVIAGTFSPSNVLCGSGLCATQVDGQPLYFDNGHLSYSMRPFWTAALLQQMPS